MTTTACASRPGHARIAIDPKLEVRAHHITIEPADLPAGWVTDGRWDRGSSLREGPIWDCSGHRANLGNLEMRAAWSSRNVHAATGPTGVISSAVFFFASTKQARAFYNLGLRWVVRYCEVRGHKDGRLLFVSVTQTPIRFERETALDFRSVETSFVGRKTTIWGDVILYQRGPIYEQLVLSQQGHPFSIPLKLRIVRTFASRAS